MKTSFYRKLRLSVFLLPLLLFVIVNCGRNNFEVEITAQNDEHPFEAYLNRTDEVYRYEHVHSEIRDGYTTHVLRMVSQRWLDEEHVNESEWWHWLTIVVPDQLTYHTGLLWIGGGTRDTKEPNEAVSFLVDAAMATNSVTADLHNVPFQPVTFTGDTLHHRYEDDLIAYGWREFMERGAHDNDAEWLARFPMTKATVRAMDTITDFLADETGVLVDRYVVAGASKRGWTTWTTGIFDDRVLAIAPVVIDLLNMLPSFEHHWQAYGEWSPAIREYENENIMHWQYSSEYRQLRELVDPYSYLDKLDLPKFIINAASDEFFLPDSWQFYWDELPGEKHLRYIPNTGHSLENTDAAESLTGFHHRIISGTPMPDFSWQVENGNIYIETDPDNPPDELVLWTAVNPEGRDFRLYVINRSWSKTPVALNDSGRNQITVDLPEQGFKAGVVEATWHDGNIPIKLTSGTVVVPDEYPHPPFSTDSPLGESIGR